jgi:hypothetical protein
MAKQSKSQTKKKQTHRAKKGKICPMCRLRLRVGEVRCYNCEPGGFK